MKPKKCKQCGDTFQPARSMQRVCGIECARADATKQREKTAAKAERAEKRETRAKLDAMRTRPQLVKAAQTAFNSYIRARDSGRTCISCGTPLMAESVGGGYDCGHYRSVGSAPHLRFDERNAHGQCKHCNRHLAGNHVAYRAGLIQRIGAQQVAELEADQELRRWSRDDLTEMAVRFRRQARSMGIAKPKSTHQIPEKRYNQSN